ncbi:MAG: DUF4340 domain-containing protein [Beijerinckiaceae bacterium]|nr:DUF4340 domain-containing protein [Beijerinckiaceae bacterium]
MNAKQLVALGMAAVFAVATTVWTVQTSPQNVASDRRGERVFPELLSRANDVVTISIRDDDKTFTVERRGDGFFDKDSGYASRPESFRDLVAGASSLTFEESKTSDPARYADLGLGEPGKGLGDKAGREVIMRDAKGAVLASVFVGNRDTTVGGARGGTFVRFPGQQQTWLARGEMRVPVPHAAWYEINLVNFTRDMLAKLELKGAGQDDYVMVSEPKGSELKLQTEVAGRQPDGGKVLRLSFMVDPISFQDVRAPKGEVKPDARQYIATSHEGLRVTVTSVGEQKDGWVRMQVEALPEASDAAKKQAADLTPKMHGYEFKLSQNDIDQMSWTLQDVTTEPKS